MPLIRQRLRTLAPGWLAGMVRTWWRKATWSLADQALFSGTNLLVQVALAHVLDATAFGIFSVLTTGAFLIDVVVGPVTIDPLPYGHGRYRGRLAATYLSSITVVNVAANTAAVMAGAVIAWLVLAADSPYRLPLLVFAAAFPLIRVQWTLRQICYVRHLPRLAAQGSLVYLLAVVTAFGLASAAAALGLNIAFIILAAAGLLSAAYYALRLRLPIPHPRRRLITAMLKRHWRYGRWLIPTGLLTWITTWGIVPITGSLVGTEAAGRLRAMQLLLQPLFQVNAALAALLLPSAVSALRTGGPTGLCRFGGRVVAVYGLYSSAYALPLILLPGLIMTIVYPAAYAGDAAVVLPILAVFGIFESLRHAAWMPPSARGATREIFLARASGSVVFVIVIGPLCSLFGLLGAAAACALAGGVIGAIALYWLHQFCTQVATAG
jgi:O-antigen/teichoic acid export membrane protein